MGQVITIKYKRSPLVQGGLEIPVEVTMHWEDKWALEILKRKMEDVLSDSDSEEPREES